MWSTSSLSAGSSRPADATWPCASRTRATARSCARPASRSTCPTRLCWWPSRWRPSASRRRAMTITSNPAESPATRRALDAHTLRADFPILRREINGHPLVYLDSASSSQKPDVVIDAVSDYYREYNANVHRGIYTIGEEATAGYELARTKVARFINAPDSHEIVFTRN